MNPPSSKPYVPIPEVPPLPTIEDNSTDVFSIPTVSQINLAAASAI